jgi:predicted transcriptional regulator of viral defense system
MKSKKNLLEQLKTMPYFSKSTVYQLGTQLGLKSTTVDTYISRFLKYKEILQLKRAVYVSSDFFNKNKDDISYPFYLANVIRTPSYVSSWAALQYYNLTTEAIYSVTSVTLKVTREYQIKAGNFAYQSIKKELFSDFSLIKGKFDFFIALPSKALFDLLYFRTRQFRGLNQEDINPLIDELRIDIDDMEAQEKEKFNTMIKKYIHTKGAPA